MLTLDEAWNKRTIHVPDNLIKITINHSIIDSLKRILQVLSSALETLKDQDVLRSELFVLSRFLYRRKAQLRRHKTRQVLTQVEKCLKRLDELNLGELMTSIHQHFTQARRNQQKGSVVHLPSRGMFEYLLLRLMGAAAILVQTVNYCVNATLVLQTELKLAHLLPSSMTCLGVVSRVWACCRSLYLECVSWYALLLPSLPVLPKGQVLLTENEVLPTDLNDWLSSKLDIENMNRDTLSCEQESGNVLLSVFGDVDKGSPVRGEKSDEEISDEVQSASQHTKDEDVGAPVTLSREELGITNAVSQNTNNIVRKKKISREVAVPVKREYTSEEEDTPYLSQSCHFTSDEDSSEEELQRTPICLLHDDIPGPSRIKRKIQKDVSDDTVSLSSPNKKRKKESLSKKAEAFRAHVVKEERPSSDEEEIPMTELSEHVIKKEPQSDSSEDEMRQESSTRTSVGDQTHLVQVKEERESSDEEHLSTETNQEISQRPVRNENVTYEDKSNLHLKILKQEITEGENAKNVVSIFLRLKPEELSRSTPWDDWPTIGYQAKKILFDTKLDSMKQCIHNSSKKKVLAKVKVHCFRYMKEVNEITKNSVSKMLTSDLLVKYVNELNDNKITFLGKTVNMSKDKAQILKQTLKSFQRKMLKVKNSHGKILAVQKKASEVLLRSLKPVFDR